MDNFKIKMAQCDLELTNSKFEECIKKPLAVVDFFADWCMPCLMMAPVIEELSEKFNGKVNFGKVNIDENSDIASKFKITSVPTLLVFKKGQVIDKIYGALPIGIIERKINEHLK